MTWIFALVATAVLGLCTLGVNAEITMEIFAIRVLRTDDIDLSQPPTKITKVSALTFPNDATFATLFAPDPLPSAIATRVSAKWKILQGGQYTFVLNSDDGSVLNINGARVVSNDGKHAAKTVSGTLTIQAGVAPFELLYFNQGGPGVLEVTISGPGIPTAVPFTESMTTNVVAPAPAPASSPPAASTGGGALGQAARTVSGAVGGTVSAAGAVSSAGAIGGSAGGGAGGVGGAGGAGGAGGGGGGSGGGGGVADLASELGAALMFAQFSGNLGQLALPANRSEPLAAFGSGFSVASFQFGSFFGTLAPPHLRPAAQLSTAPAPASTGNAAGITNELPPGSVPAGPPFNPCRPPPGKPAPSGVARYACFVGIAPEFLFLATLLSASIVILLFSALFAAIYACSGSVPHRYVSKLGCDTADGTWDRIAATSLHILYLASASLTLAASFHIRYTFFLAPVVTTMGLALAAVALLFLIVTTALWVHVYRLDTGPITVAYATSATPPAGVATAASPWSKLRASLLCCFPQAHNLDQRTKFLHKSVKPEFRHYWCLGMAERSLVALFVGCVPIAIVQLPVILFLKAAFTGLLLLNRPYNKPVKNAVYIAVAVVKLACVALAFCLLEAVALDVATSDRVAAAIVALQMVVMALYSLFKLWKLCLLLAKFLPTRLRSATATAPPPSSQYAAQQQMGGSV